MPLLRANLVFMLSATLVALPAFATRTQRAHRTTLNPHAAHARTLARTAHHKPIPKAKRLHGQQSIESGRVTEIQQALIREHYMSGEANGTWDTGTEAAMRKFQADQGWKSKLMPDSRALKKLGLGPDYSTAINAKNSTFAAPPPVSTIPAEQASGFAQASGINR